MFYVSFFYIKVKLASKECNQMVLADKQCNEYNEYLIYQNIIIYLSSICNKLTSTKVSN